MANMLSKIKNYFSATEDEYDDDSEYYEDEEIEEAPPQKSENKKEGLISYSPRSSRNNQVNSDSNIVDIRPHKNTNVTLTSPKTVDESGVICDYLKAGKSVILNLESLDHEMSQRIIDFLSGVIYSLEGDIKAITNKVFVLVPKHVEITSFVEDEFKANGFLYSFAQSIGNRF